MKPAEQSAKARAPLPHEVARYCGHEHDAHVAALVLEVRRRAAAQALRTLRSRLPRAAVRELMQALREHVAVSQMVQTWPTPVQQHDIGAQIATHAQGLRACLLALPPTTGQKLWLAVSDALGDSPPSRSDTERILAALEFVCRSSAAQMKPPQARRRAHVDIVASVGAGVDPPLFAGEVADLR